MPRYCPRCGETLHSHGTTKGETRKTARRAYEKPKTSRAKDPKMARAMTEAHAKAKKKDGKFKKGWNQSRLMSEAHRLKRKM